MILNVKKNLKVEKHGDLTISGAAPFMIICLLG
jgi:hypothetical protein